MCTRDTKHTPIFVKMDIFGKIEHDDDPGARLRRKLDFARTNRLEIWQHMQRGKDQNRQDRQRFEAQLLQRRLKRFIY